MQESKYTRFPSSCQFDERRKLGIVLARHPVNSYNLTANCLASMLIVFVALGVYFAVEAGLAPAVQMLAARRTPGSRR